jgi:anti-anti-sigma factor
MDINEETLDQGVFKINLSGKMDITGVTDISTQFTEMCAAPKPSIIVDMSGVHYMSSIGIRELLLNAKSVHGRGAKYAILSPQTVVRDVLEISGISQLITICDNLEDAIEKVTA